MAGHDSRSRRLAEICGSFLKLGLTSFGGPIAHLSYLRAEFVSRRRWLDDAAYGDLVALCQFLPGPASSQIVFALGMQRAGLAGAICASLCFTLPSAIAMIVFGYGVAAIGDLHGAGWLHGLKLAAVAVVTQAVWGMGRNLCPDRNRITLCLASATVLLAFPGALCQIVVIATGASIGWWLYRGTIQTPAAVAGRSQRTRLAAATALVVFTALLIIAPILSAVESKPASSGRFKTSQFQFRVA